MAALSTRSGRETAADPDAFLEEIAHLQEDRPASEGVGAAPPVDADPTMVPDIEVETTRFDVGTIPNDGPYRATLNVKNQGRAPLEISDIKTTCACTQGVIPPSAAAIAPGDTAELEVVVLPNRIPGFYSEKTLTIYSNDLDEPAVNVDVVARIEQEFELVPEELNFGAVAKAAEPEKTILLRQLQAGPCEVKGAGFYPVAEPKERNAPEDLAFTVLKRPETEWRSAGMAEYEITVRVLPVMAPGEFRRRVFIRTNVPRLPAVPYTVVGVVDAPYTVEPAHPAALVLQGVEGASAAGEVVVRGKSSLRLESVVVSNPAVTARVTAGDNPNEARLAVGVAEGAPSGAIDAELRFDVCAEGVCVPERVKVRGFIRPEGVAP